MTESTEALQRTPLFESHVAAGGKMVPFGGWEMPLHYGSQIDEHHATRRNCGLFDVSHMGEVEVMGPDALRLVQEIITNDASRLADGEEIYTAMCRENGGLVDDLIVTRFAADQFFIVVNAATYKKDVEHMRHIAARLNLTQTELIPCAEKWAMIAVQGPKWEEVCITALGEGPWQKLKPFNAVRMHMGEEIIFSATGYTGEPGCELLCPPNKAVALWNALVEAGGRPCGLAARDTLRLEKGFCLSGQDFTEENNPLEAGLAWVTKLDKPSFSGREALLKIKKDGVKKKLVGLLPEGKRFARHGNAILSGGKPVGEITSGGYSPSLERPIAMGYVAPELAKPGQELEVNLGTTTIKAKVAKPPFYPAKDAQ